MKKKYLWIGILIFIICFCGLRLWNLENRINFSMDQGMFMLRAREIWDNKELILLGPTASPIVEGRHFFQGPVIYYSLTLLGLLGNWDPIKISWWLVVLNLLGGYFLFLTIKLLANTEKAIMGLIIFCLLPTAIEFSNFIWNPNFLLFLMPIFLYFYIRSIKEKRLFLSVVAGMMGGICLQFHFQFVPILVISVIYLFYKNKRLLLPYLGGIGLGYLPLIIFDLRNDFYNIKTVLEWIVNGDKNRGFFSYDFLVYIPILIVVWCMKAKLKISLILICGIFIWSLLWMGQQKQSAWMPKSWTYGKLLDSAEIIRRSEGSVNVVNLLNGDTRFYGLRYLLNDIGIAEVNEYSNVDSLWVVTDKSESDLLATKVYELDGFNPKIIENKHDLGEGVFLYKLVRENSDHRFVTIVNPIRSRELWKDRSLKPIDDQYQAISKFNLKATWLVQNDILADKELVDKIKSFDKNQELGIFLEVSKDLAYKSRVYFDEQKPWYSPGVVFLSGYGVGDRQKIIDKMMSNFEATFGYLPKSVGAWWIDSYSQQYLENKYQIKTILICADQKTTDKYGIWGQWWGYPYIPSSDNILVPGSSKTVVIQWAQRDLTEAYHGQGWEVSNHSLQANDYTSLGLDIKYFEKLAQQYLSVEKLGQITVGLETGMESVGNEIEYEKQLKWLSDNKVSSLKMSEFGDKYRETYGNKNPEKIILEDWVMTPIDRTNQKLGEKTEYKKDLVFADSYQKDSSEFLNRVYKPENLVKKRIINWEIIIKALLVIGSLIIILRWKRRGLIILVVTCLIMWMLMRARYTVTNGETMIGFLIDNFRFVGINLKQGFVNTDLSNLVAQSMLRLKLW